MHSLRSRNGRDLAREGQIFLLGSLRDKPVTKIGAPLQETLPPAGIAPLFAAVECRRPPTCASSICAASPALLHRVAVMSAGTLDSLPHNGAVVTLLAVCGVTHRESYFDIFMVAIVGALVALAAVIVLGSALGSF